MKETVSKKQMYKEGAMPKKGVNENERNNCIKKPIATENK